MNKKRSLMLVAMLAVIACLASPGPANAASTVSTSASGHCPSPACCPCNDTDISFLYGTYWHELEALSISPDNTACYTNIPKDLAYVGDWRVIDSSHIRIQLYDLQYGAKNIDARCYFARAAGQVTIVMDGRAFVKTLA